MRAMRHRSRGFTISEILVVIGIIAILLAILIPVINKARSAANDASCASNIRQIMNGFLSFATDNDGHLPGSMYGVNDGSFTQSDWLFGQGNFNTSPQSGSVFRYVNNRKVYRCPSLDSMFAAGTQSNGRFDYAFFVCFAGARVTNVKRDSKLYNLDGSWTTAATPILVQEDPYQFNGYNIEGDHSNVDQMSHIHNGGSYYGTIDGSVQWANEPDVPNSWSNGCWQWTSITPSGREYSLATYGGWNWWSAQ